jgi:hypothetical protein
MDCDRELFDAAADVGSANVGPGLGFGRSAGTSADRIVGA